jgi:nitrogenase subunit NifH
MLKLNKIIIISGHFGCGKTNFSVNLAFDLKNKGNAVTIVDLDIVNPYFRTSDFENIISKAEIKTINPIFAGTNLDVPSLPPELNAVFSEDYEGYVIIDVGGDDAGAIVLGCYADMIKKIGYTMLYIINGYRLQITNPKDALYMLENIEKVSKLKFSGIINSSNLGTDTTPDDILDKLSFSKNISQLTNLKIFGVVINEDLLYEERLKEIEDIIPVKLYVKQIWQD